MSVRATGGLQDGFTGLWQDVLPAAPGKRAATEQGLPRQVGPASLQIFQFGPEPDG